MNKITAYCVGIAEADYIPSVPVAIWESDNGLRGTAISFTDILFEGNYQECEEYIKMHMAEKPEAFLNPCDFWEVVEVSIPDGWYTRWCGRCERKFCDISQEVDSMEITDNLMHKNNAIRAGAREDENWDFNLHPCSEFKPNEQ